jgi:hypothetical protein
MTGQTLKEAMVEDVFQLVEEVKLLAINLAVAMARLKRDNLPTDLLEPHVSNLINQAVAASDKVRVVLEATRGQRALLYELPPSSETSARRGAYDQIEQSLLHVHDLSQYVIESITRLTGKSV